MIVNRNEKSNGVAVVGKKSKIGQLVETAKIEGSEYDEINFGVMPNYQAQNINAATGVFVRSATLILTTHGIRHASDGHGDNTKESERGQVGITDADFDLLPEILKNPDSYVRGNMDYRRREEAVVFTKKINSVIYHVVMAVQRSKEGVDLVFKTMYIRK